MTLDELDKDMAIAAVLAFKASTPDRRLAGAEWLQQLAGQLVEALKDEQFKPLAEAFDAAVRDNAEPEQPAEETPNPGEGWRTLEFREIIQEGDEYFSPRLRTWFESKDIGGRAYAFTYRRSIQPEPEKARYFTDGETIWKMTANSGQVRTKSGKTWSTAVSRLAQMHRPGFIEITAKEGEP